MANLDSTGGEERPRAVLTARVALILAVAAAFFVPRLVSFTGLSLTESLHFADMHGHIHNLDKLLKRCTLGADQRNDPYFAKNPGGRDLANASRWPAGVYYVALPWAWLWGPLSIWTTQLTNLLFSIVLVLGVVGLGREVHDTRAGLWAALLTVLCPPLVAGSWYFNLDYPLTAMTTVGLLLLLRTGGFTSWRAALLFGGWSGLGLFVKQSYAIYLLVPSIWVLITGLRRAGERRRVLAGVTLSLSAALLLTLGLQGAELVGIWRDVVRHWSSSEELVASVIRPWTFGWLTAYAQFAMMSFRLPLLALCIPGVVLLHRRSPIVGRGLLLAFLYGSYVLLTLIDNKLERYLHPLYPVLCLVSVLWIVHHIPRRWQVVLLGLVAAGYAATVVLVHEKPAPWAMGIDSTAALGLFYDLPMPTRADLAALRANTYHTRCELEPAVREIGAFARRVPRRAMGVVYDAGPEGAGREVIEPWVFDQLAIHVVRDRFVFGFELMQREGLPAATLLIHSPAVDPRRLCPAVPATDRRLLHLRCEELEVPLVVTLLQPAKIGQPCGEAAR